MAPHATGTATPPHIPTNNGVSKITVLTSSRAVINDRLTPATIVISTTTGKITSVSESVLPSSDFPPGTPHTDYSPAVLLLDWWTHMYT